MIEEAPSRAEDGWTKVSPHPWRRWAARLADSIILGAIFWFALPIAFLVIAPEAWLRIEPLFYEPWFRFAETAISILVLIPVNAILIGAARMTPGKFLFGVRVCRRDGRSLGFPAALLREIRVWIIGMGLGIPLVSLFTMWAAKTHLEDNGTTSWDRDGRHVVYYRVDGGLQTLLAIVGIFVIVGGVAGTRLLSAMADGASY